RPITEVRAAAAGLGIRWWTITPFAREDPSGQADRTTTPGAHVDGGRPWNDAGRATPREKDRFDPASDAGLPADSEGRESLRMMASPATAYHGETARVTGDVRGWLADGWRVALVTEGHGPAQRLAELLRGENLGARAADLEGPPEPGVAVVATG